MVKIYKTDLQGLLEEVADPIYVFPSSSQIVNGDIVCIIYTTTVSGFNKDGRVCELRISTEPTPSQLVEEWRKNYDVNEKTYREVVERLKALERVYYDGLISDKPVEGVLR